jgi:S1-C subfamily serine protease
MKKFIVSTLLVLLAACTKSHHAENTVMITNLAGNSGGTGSVISSSKDYSEILTNRHVCRVVKNGGKVITEDGVVHTVLRYRPSTAHDVCVITVPGDLGLSLPVATRPLQKYEKLTVAGHPHLSPTIITEGYASSRIIVPVMTGTRDCKDSDREDPEKALFCLFFGKVPVIVFYDAQMTSALIQPGSSGSAVYNDAGELAGVAFAGAGDLGLVLLFLGTM